MKPFPEVNVESHLEEIEDRLIRKYDEDQAEYAVSLFRDLLNDLRKSGQLIDHLPSDAPGQT